MAAFEATHPIGPTDGAYGHPSTLREWLARPELLAPPTPIATFLAWPARVTLLSARAKGGKSTIVGQAAAAVSSGALFLDEPTRKGPVLWYAIDENPGDAVQRLANYDANIDNTFIVDSPPSASDLRNDIEMTRAQFVVIDTLTELWANCIESDRDANDVARFIRPYVEATRKSGAALALLHHTTKSGEQFRGSEQLAAAVDIVLTLRQPAMRPALPIEVTTVTSDEGFGVLDDGRRRLEGKGRASVRIDERLYFDGKSYSRGEGSLTLETRILRLLHHEPRSATSLAETFRVRKETMLATVQAMVDQCLIVRKGRPQKLFLTDAGIQKCNR